MKFLVDEDVPIKLLKALKSLSHDAVRVEPSASDITNAKRAKEEDRILISLDRDITDSFFFPPSEFNIIHIDIHPPYSEIIIAAFKRLLNDIPADRLKGLIILTREGHFRIS